MGCGGCELFPSPSEILNKIDQETGQQPGTALALLREIIDQAYSEIQNPEPEHTRAVTTTNIWQARKELEVIMESRFGAEIGRAARNAIESSITCYASKLHLNKALSIFNPTRHANAGYAPVFERVTRFPGRMAQIANSPQPNQPDKPWLDDLPHLIFVSDMGDSFSRRCDFEFLRLDAMPAIRSVSGRRKLWLWLTKRPELMAEFAEEIGGFPSNVCAMTTITSNATLHRVDQLRNVAATTRGLSIEPLWERIEIQNLDLTGIDWLIVGGESGKFDIVRPFHLEWAQELYQHCIAQGVAFFLKQLGRRPIYRGQLLELHDCHGGDWDEWPNHLRVREFPGFFHEFGE
jgi:protein gp37